MNSSVSYLRKSAGRFVDGKDGGVFRVAPLARLNFGQYGNASGSGRIKRCIYAWRPRIILAIHWARLVESFRQPKYAEIAQIRNYRE